MSEVTKKPKRGPQLRIRTGRPARGRPFQKGQKRIPGSGRAKGTPNKVSREIKEFLISLSRQAEYQAGLAKRIRAGKAPTIEQLMLHWAGGKPAETHEVSVGTLDHLYALAASRGLGEREDEDGGSDVGGDAEQQDRG